MPSTDPTEPFVSVVMPVRNARPYLDDALQSIVEQTHRNLELVIRDDASDDGSVEVLRGWAARDPRIRLFEGSEALGPAESSNWVVRQARGALVARMDADDVSHPDRLRRQVAVLRRHPDVVLVGSLFDGIDARSCRVRSRSRWRLAQATLQPPFQHGSVLFRRETFERIGGYRAACEFWEDNDLFLRFAAAGRVVVLPDCLYRYRFSATSIRNVTSRQRMEAALERIAECLDAHARGESYEPRLAAPAPDPAARVAPRVFLAAGGPRLWAGRSPGVLGALLRRGRLRADRETAAVLAWAVLGTASPRLLRRLLAARAWLRDLRVRHRFPDGTLCEWPLRPSAGA